MICLIGTVLKDRYCVIERIGHGGGGSLYLARDMELGIYRAVKEISIDRKREAKLMRLLEHPAIPRIVDYVEEEEFCYLIMEYIRGQSLGEILDSRGAFSTEETLQFGREMAKVLEYLHSRKPAVCYGDLKPDNLMLAESGHLYLVDLGSAMPDYKSEGRECEGTRGYAAPEQYQGRLSPASDIYALGKTLQVLCGKRNLMIFLYPEFFWFLFRCTRKQEKHRYPDMASVRRILEKLGTRYHTVTWRKRFLEASSVVFLVSVLFWAAGALKPADFSEAVSEVTELYYQAEQQQMESSDPLSDEISGKRLFRSAEKKLQKMNRIFQGKEEQRHIALLLAWNAELSGEPERAALYYENLLLYDEGFRDGYGEYGMFLIRKGQEEASRKLWKDYQKKERENLLEAGKGRNLLLWEEMNEKKQVK